MLILMHSHDYLSVRGLNRPSHFNLPAKQRILFTDSYRVLHLMQEDKVEEEKWSGGRVKSKIQPPSREKSSTHPEGHGVVAGVYSNGGVGAGGAKLSSYQKPKLRREKAEGEVKELESLGDLSLESLCVYDSPHVKCDADSTANKNKSSKNALLAKLKSKVARRNSYDSSEAEEEYPSGAALSQSINPSM